MKHGEVPQDGEFALYMTSWCSFCGMVVTAASQLGVDLPMRDIDQGSEWRQELVEATGRETVPCLRIDGAEGSSFWMHESRDIIRYLEERFGAEPG